MAKKKEENIEEELSWFEKFLNIVRGKVDIKYRLRLLLDPDNIKTSSRLTRGQIEFCSIATFAARYFPQFKPLQDYAENHFALWTISEAGLGRDEAIRYEGAIGETKLLQKIGLFKTEEGKAKATTKD